MVKDILGLEGPICKVIDCFKDGVSSIFGPWQYKRMENAKIEMDEKRSLSEQKMLIKKALTQDLIEHAHNIRDKKNIENLGSIYSPAVLELANEKQLPAMKVSPEWSARFFDYTKDCCDEEVQLLWSKILAGEIRKPGSYYKRTLTVLHDLERFEAEWFVKAKPFIVSNCIIPSFTCTNNELLNFNEILSLVDCGLINANKCEVSIWSNEIYVCNLHLVPDKDCREFTIVGYSLTDAGMQLSTLIQADTNNSFIERLTTDFEKQNSIKLTPSLSALTN